MKSRSKTAEEQLPDLRDEVETFRSLQSYCSHDLRGEIGRAMTSIQLIKDLVGQEASGRELFDLAEASLQEAIDHLDAKLARYSPSLRHAWLFSTTESLAQFETDPLHEGMLAHCFTTFEQLSDRRGSYRPDKVCLDLRHRPAVDATKILLYRIGTVMTQVLVVIAPGDREYYAPIIQNSTAHVRYQNTSANFCDEATLFLQSKG